MTATTEGPGSGLAHLGDDPTLGRYAERINTMPKYVASRTLRAPLGPRIFDGVGPVQLQLVASTAYPSGVVWLRYRPADDPAGHPLRRVASPSPAPGGTNQQGTATCEG